jgi:hypothetical protein
MSIAIRVVQRLALRTFRGAAKRGRLIAIAMIAAAALLVANTLNLWPVGLGTYPAAGRWTSYTTAENEPNATASYIRGQQTYDARLIWESYSPRSVRAIERRGGSIEETQRQLNRVREAGNRIDQAQYVGGYPIPDGSLHFYVLTRTGPTGADVIYVPYTFTLDGSGKIEGVEIGEGFGQGYRAVGT